MTIMNTIRKFILIIVAVFTLHYGVLARAESLMVANPDNETKLLSAQTGDHLNPRIIQLGIIAYNNAVKEGVVQQRLLTIVDFSMPSTEKRFWVFDLDHHRVLFNKLVAHGKYTGGIHAASFSNAMNSHKSSLGIYVTENTYVGKMGYSLRLHGLEEGINDNVKKRGIVIHSSYFVSHEFIRLSGQLGRSKGCLALSRKCSRAIIDTIKNGSIIMVYHPASGWVSRSRFLRTA